MSRKNKQTLALEKKSLDLALLKKKPLPQESSPKILLNSFIIGAVAALIYVFLQMGPLFRREWTYLFYGIMLLAITVNFLIIRKSGVFARLSYTISAYVMFVSVTFAIVYFANYDRIDLRVYLNNNATTILQRYKSQENYTDNAFLDPTGYVYYSNVAESDISSLVSLRRNQIWKDSGSNTCFMKECLDWFSPDSYLIRSSPEKYQALLSHPDTLCSRNLGVLCANRTTLEVAYISF